MEYEAAGQLSGPAGGTRLTVVVPAFNEANRLPESLRQIADHLRRQSHWLPAEVIVVDDGSVDGTAPAASTVPMVDDVRLEVAAHDRNRGKGAAVRTGFERSVGDRLLLCDADLASPIDQLEVLRRSADARSVVIGSRALDRSLIAIRQPSYRDMMGRTFNLAVQTLALPGIQDTQCGFKLFPGALGRALARVQRIDGFAFDVELLLLAQRWGFRLREVPVVWRHVEASRVQAVQHSTQMLGELVGLWLRRLRGRLPARPHDLEEPVTEWS
jgi:dolichyl-phosphate beta-glucosyltransferase